LLTFHIHYILQIRYWQDEADNTRDTSTYDLTVVEILTDLFEENIQFKGLFHTSFLYTFIVNSLQKYLTGKNHRK